MSIDQAIRDDLQRIFKSKEFQTKVTEPTAEKLKNTIKSQSRKGLDTSGKPFISLRDRHKKRKDKWKVKPNIANLHYKSRGGDGASKGAFSDGVFGYNPYGNEAKFNFGGESQMERYMNDHQRGHNGMPERKWFPDSKSAVDESGPTVQMSGKKVEEEVRKLFNKQRKIVVNG